MKHLVSINNTIGVLGQTRGGANVGVALGERLAINMQRYQDVKGQYTVEQIAEGMAGIGQPLTAAEMVALEAVGAAKVGG